ncbi:Glycosyltransferase involved in cell wall bisynthesis [Arachidicoccus rhizosphaerae]|uniref:Glycosyltransferase involved in cell wall bisynthesis n=1 Tax=Arachidicoccus rhizosphaerae TaxID=551991 RepID=A0A1H4AEB1_9BACT|nr:glycosyltransferase [Arachidicoccus rhizosphaerae]SEA33844.1 Glycosyltransferase involved in cell wall bisynthesis [Arachidicoccus rhizosphaerae]
MRILHLIFSFNVGGAEAMLADIINSQCKQAVMKLIIVNSGINETLKNSISQDVEIVCLNRKPGSVNPLPMIQLNREILKFKPDVIHCHNHNMVNTIWALSYRQKTILTIHDTGGDIRNLEKFRKCFAISEAVKNDVYDRSKLDIDIVYNGIRCNDIKIKGEGFDSALQVSNIKIVQVSRLHHEKKGQHLVLFALKRIIQKGYPPFQLDFIGAGKSNEYLQGLASELGISDYVHFLGIRSREYIYEHLREYDLLIQPSLNEGFGLTIAEAMAAKVPVLVSNIEGPMELIKDGKYGSYFESGNVEDLTFKLIEFSRMRTSAVLEKRVESAYDYCNGNFNIAVTATKYLNSYKTL